MKGWTIDVSCYHPLKAFYRLGENGKKEIAFCSSEQAWKNGYLFKGNTLYGNKIELPCGQCIGCRLDYSRQWAIRCLLESQQWIDNWFLTLTYDDEHLPIRQHAKVDSETGEVVSLDDVAVLVPDDLSQFMKNLRRYYDYHYNRTNIRFYGCGEYGEQKQRPHLHIIVFNLPIPDIRLSDRLRSHSGKPFFESEVISKVWGKGLVGIGDLTFDSAAYTARYMLKKHKGKDFHYYADNGLVPEFTRMSRDPGIAREYFDKNSGKIYQCDELFITNGKGEPIKVKPPKYYDRLFDVQEPETMSKIKEVRRSVAEAAKRMALQRTSLNDDEYLSVCEFDKVKKISALKRDLD